MAVGSARGTEWNTTRLQVLQRDGYICVYCGNEATEADHVIPRSKGGTDTTDNLVAACRRCNGSKSDSMETRMNWFNRNWLDNL